MTKIAAIAVGYLLVAWASPASAQGWSYCAAEGQFCSAPEGSIIHYGAQGVFTQAPSPPGGLVCGNEVFGDPIFNVRKACYISQGYAPGAYGPRRRHAPRY
jgi:hypothetical protein